MVKQFLNQYRETITFVLWEVIYIITTESHNNINTQFQ